MNTEEATSEIEHQYDVIAEILGIDRATLPTTFDPVPPPRKTRLEEVVGDVDLSDFEWTVINPVFPKGIAHHSRDDRAYLNACLWRERAKSLKAGWWFVPSFYGPTSSNRGRFLRWCKLGYWEQLVQGLVAAGSLSEERIAEFSSIAREARSRRERLSPRR